MPAPALRKLARRAKKSYKDAERYWKQAKGMAARKGFKEGSEQFYRYVMGIVTRRLGLASIVESGIMSPEEAKRVTNQMLQEQETLIVTPTETVTLSAWMADRRLHETFANFTNSITVNDHFERLPGLNNAIKMNNYEAQIKAAEARRRKGQTPDQEHNTLPIIETQQPIQPPKSGIRPQLTLKLGQ